MSSLIKKASLSYLSSSVQKTASEWDKLVSSINKQTSTSKGAPSFIQIKVSDFPQKYQKILSLCLQNSEDGKNLTLDGTFNELTDSKLKSLLNKIWQDLYDSVIEKLRIDADWNLVK